MQIIRKKINIECARSRQQGLLPYIKYNDSDASKSYVTSGNTDGNYGNFPYNITKADTNIKFANNVVNYMDIIYRYNKIYNILNYGLLLKKVSGKQWTSRFENTDSKPIYGYLIKDKINIKATNSEFLFESNIDINSNIVNFVDDTDELLEYCWFFNSEITDINKYKDAILDPSTNLQMSQIITKLREFMEFVDNKLIGKLNVPYSIHGAKVPEFFCYCDILEWLQWFQDNENDKETDCCIKQEWEYRGGDEMYTFLKQKKDLYTNGIVDATKLASNIPYIEVPILLRQKIENIGVMTADLEGTNNGKDSFKTISMTTQVIYSESRLQDVRSDVKYYDDNGELLDILLYGDSACTTPYEIMNNPSGFKYPYKENTIIGLSYNRYYSEDGNALKKKDNDGYTEMRGNIITNIDTATTGYVTFEYVIGALIKIKETTDSHSVKTDKESFFYKTNATTYDYNSTTVVKDTGIKYKETYKLINGEKTILFNGKNITLTGTSIDYDSNKKTVYSNELGQYRETNIAEIIDYHPADSFIDNDMEELAKYYYIENDEEYTGSTIQEAKSYDVPIYKEDSLNGITANIIEKVDVSIDRGRASAFETHYKLSECSTFEDLENYGNNYFNL